MDVLAQLIGEGHLVADGRCKAITSGLHIGLNGLAPAEGGHGQIEEGGDGTQQFAKGHKLANRHQVAFVVAIALAEAVLRLALLVLPAKADEAVVEAALGHIHILDAGDESHLVVVHGAVQIGQKLLHVIFKRRYRRLGPDDDLGILIIAGQIQITQQGRLDVFRIPLGGLGNIALHQGELDRLAFCGPVDRFEQGASGKQGHRQQQPERLALLQAQADGGRAEQQSQGDALHAKEGGDAN